MGCSTNWPTFFLIWETAFQYTSHICRLILLRVEDWTKNQNHGSDSFIWIYRCSYIIVSSKIKQTELFPAGNTINQWQDNE